jgi:virulence-associated protein VapD
MDKYALFFILDEEKINKEFLNQDEKYFFIDEEIPMALANCGFLKVSGNFYMNSDTTNPLHSMVLLKGKIASLSRLPRYILEFHLFRIAAHEDVTSSIRIYN